MLDPYDPDVLQARLEAARRKTYLGYSDVGFLLGARIMLGRRR